MPADEARPNYGVDAPGVVLTFGMLGIIFTFVGIFVGSAAGIGAAIVPWIGATVCLGTAGTMIWFSKVSKPAIWAEHLDGLGLRGDERVLDVGCGRGLVTIELAKRLPRGEVVGLDIWRSKDQSGNGRVNTELNLRVAGVSERVEIVDADMTKIPFGDDEFDLVTASLAIHNIPAADGRDQAMREITRVTKPGGRVLIIDIARTADYEAALRSVAWTDVSRSSRSVRVYPPVRTVTGRKPNTPTG